MDCHHTVTQGRSGETGSWCCKCGVKVYDVDTRPCSGCAHYRADHSHPFYVRATCRRHLMAVTPDMRVTFKISEGTCFTPAASSGEKETQE